MIQNVKKRKQPGIQKKLMKWHLDHSDDGKKLTKQQTLQEKLQSLLHKVANISCLNAD